MLNAKRQVTITTMSTPPQIDPVPPLLIRLSLGAQAWAFKAVINTIFATFRLLRPSVFSSYAPTYSKKYPVRPTLACRFFIPKTYQAGSSLPLYVNIHGGGFFAGDARFDDKICHYFCNRFNHIVVSLQYRLAPSYPFPVPVDDCTELLLAVLSDSDLPIDRNRVAVAGGSAGGSLALAASQNPRLRSQIKAIVAFYPATDFSRQFAGDYRDKPAGPDGKGARRDGLRSIDLIAEWAYVPHGQDRTDPRLSPVFADPATLPRHIYFLAAQYDKLCQEAFAMARRLSGGGETLKEEEDWEVRGIRWERLSDEVHGFIEMGWHSEVMGGDVRPWKKEVEAVLERVGAWLEGFYRMP